MNKTVFSSGRNGSLLRNLSATLFLLLLATSANAADQIRCVFPFWFGNAPVFVANELGYFAEEGLTVTTAFDNDRANVMPAMAGGSVDCTIRTIGEEMSRPRAADTTGTVIGTIDISAGADGVVAGPEIKTVEDLIGKTLAGEVNHPGTVMLQFALSQKGKSIKDLTLKMIATDDSAAVFEDPSIAAVATWEPMMGMIVKNTSRRGAHILLSSKDFDGLITDVILVRSDDLAANPKKYSKFLRGIYRAIDFYKTNPKKFVEISAPAFKVSIEEMTASLTGLRYTDFEEAVTYMPSTNGDGKLRGVLDSFNKINVELKLQDGPLNYVPFVDGSVIGNLFDGKKR